MTGFIEHLKEEWMRNSPGSRLISTIILTNWATFTLTAITFMLIDYDGDANLAVALIAAFGFVAAFDVAFRTFLKLFRSLNPELYDWMMVLEERHYNLDDPSLAFVQYLFDKKRD